MDQIHRLLLNRMSLIKRTRGSIRESWVVSTKVDVSGSKFGPDTSTFIDSNVSYK